MSDISQHGLIGTLQWLNDNPALDAELQGLTRDRPVALILPCHAGDLERPALEGIIRELSRATFLGEVIIPVNGFPPSPQEGFARARAFFANGSPSRTGSFFARRKETPPPPSARAKEAMSGPLFPCSPGRTTPPSS